jgi:hypothetical protein
MLAARVPQYETTTNVRIESGRATAYFSSTNQIRVGQTALVALDGKVIPARVNEVAADHAELVFTSNQQPATISNSATAEVEISRLSPAAIALHALGRAHQ